MKARLMMVVLAWAAAFVIVMAIFLALGDQLARMSLPLRALIVSGVLATVMTQVVVPWILKVVAKYR